MRKFISLVDHCSASINHQVLHIASHVEIHNSSSLSFRVSVIGEDSVHDLGLVHRKRKSGAEDESKSLLKKSEDLITHSCFGLSTRLLQNFTLDTSETLCIQMSPVLEDSALVGMFNLPHFDSLVKIASSDESKTNIEVICSPASSPGNRTSSLSANISCCVSLVDGSHPFVELFIEPRAIIKNKLPVRAILQTPMPYTFLSAWMPQRDCTSDESEDPNYTVHRLMPLESIEVFTPGPSLAVSIRCADSPIAGTPTGWVEGTFLDIPLKNKILEPLNCVFPFKTESLDRYESLSRVAGCNVGSNFFVLEANDVTPDLKTPDEKSHSPVVEKVQNNSRVRTVVFIVCNYAVDHTGNLLFEKIIRKENNTSRRGLESASATSLITGSPPYSAFSSSHHRRRVSLLPDSSDYIRLVKLTMEGDEGRQMYRYYYPVELYHNTGSHIFIEQVWCEVNHLE